MDNPSTTQPTMEPATTEPVTKTATEARQGVTPGIVRWMLAISLTGAIIAMIVAYWYVRGI